MPHRAYASTLVGLVMLVAGAWAVPDKTARDRPDAVAARHRPDAAVSTTAPPEGPQPSDPGGDQRARFVP